MGKQKVATTSTGAPIRRKPLSTRMWNARGYYLMFLPVFIYVLIVYYWPMLGVRYAFYDYSIKNFEFIGLENFKSMFSTKDFWRAFSNTLQISVIKLLITTFTSVLVSVFLNEMGNMFAKKTLQTIIYLPHFMSWAVVAAIFTLFLSKSSSGFINETLKSWGVISKSIDFLHSKDWWRPIYYIINIWKETGWGTVIFLATLSGINPELHEAAVMDGANKYQRVWHIDLPGILPTVVIMFILSAGKVMTVGFEKAYLMQTSLNISASEIIATYVYKRGLQQNQFDFSTAVGLFESVVNLVMITTVNYLSRKISDSSLF